MFASTSTCRAQPPTVFAVSFLRDHLDARVTLRKLIRFKKRRCRTGQLVGQYAELNWRMTVTRITKVFMPAQIEDVYWLPCKPKDFQFVQNFHQSNKTAMVTIAGPMTCDSTAYKHGNELAAPSREHPNWTNLRGGTPRFEEEAHIWEAKLSAIDNNGVKKSSSSGPRN